MATQKDVQDLLRMLTTGRNKVPMMKAMATVKSLQAEGIRTLSDIASADLTALSKAAGDEKSAKQLKAAAKKESDGSKKVGSPETAKRKRSAYELDAEPESPQAAEANLTLEISDDEEEMSKTVLFCNRAPLVLAFAYALLKYTMPEQPPSSRLSLAQAVVSLNSQSKAVSIGIASGPSAESAGFGIGQPKIKIMGRDVHILKRGGYEWKPPHENETGSRTEDENKLPATNDEERITALGPTGGVTDRMQGGDETYGTAHPSQWAVSKSITEKDSTFVARSIAIQSSAHAKRLLRELMEQHPELRSATHHITAWRVQEGQRIVEECNDDGETGGGLHTLKALQAADLKGVMVVTTRWFGGQFLSKRRWEIMSDVCQDVLSQRLRIPGTIGQEALWGLDLEAMRSTNAPVIGNMPVHKPESARAYILKAFPSAESTNAKKKTGVALEREKAHNLSLLLGALDKLFSSWTEHITRGDLDRRAWDWYTNVRPTVEIGQAGWGQRGQVDLNNILRLRRKS